MNNLRYNQPVARIASWLMLIEAAFLCVPLIVEILLGEPDWPGFATAAGVSGVAGGFGAWFFGKSELKLSRRDAFMLITLIWILFSAVSMIPFMMSTVNPLDAASAYFESISGFTTTGATTIADVEVLSHGLLLWRAMTQLVGGLGIVLFLIALLPALNDSGGIMMFNAEITGMTHDKLHPRIKQTAVSLWMVYLGLTVAQSLILTIGGMSVFDSLCQAMATLSTGGFSTRNASIAGWGSPFVAAATSVFMLLGGINFILIYNALRGRWRDMFSNDVFRVYLATVAVCSVVTGAEAFATAGAGGVDGLVIAPFFHTVSAITSTGFGYGDFAAWGPAVVMLTIVLMTCGACAGSTTGAIKLDRIVVGWKNMLREISTTLHPRHIRKFRVTRRVVTDGLMLRVGAFIAIYLSLLTIGTSIMTAFGYPVADSLFSCASCLGNNGLGYGTTAAGYGHLPAAVKWTFSLLMLIGRLEIFPVLALLLPGFWRKP